MAHHTSQHSASSGTLSATNMKNIVHSMRAASYALGGGIGSARGRNRTRSG
jgi:hypothetical protein